MKLLLPFLLFVQGNNGGVIIYEIKSSLSDFPKEESTIATMAFYQARFV